MLMSAAQRPAKCAPLLGTQPTLLPDGGLYFYFSPGQKGSRWWRYIASFHPPRAISLTQAGAPK